MPDRTKFCKKGFVLDHGFSDVSPELEGRQDFAEKKKKLIYPYREKTP